MPTIPESALPPGTQTTPMQSPSPENLLMAAAEMQRMGRFDKSNVVKLPTKATHGGRTPPTRKR